MSDEIEDRQDTENYSHHNQSSNRPLLCSWIDELTSLTYDITRSKEIPTSESFINSMTRYNAVFTELLSQTSVYNEHLTKMMSKTWIGCMQLIEILIKVYHKHVKATDQTRNQAHHILREKSKEDAAIRNKEEHLVLERTVLRARIRGLEAEVESMTAALHIDKKEIRYLRLIVDEYIRSSDVNVTAAGAYPNASYSERDVLQEYSRTKKNTWEVENLKNVPSTFARKKNTAEIGRCNLTLLTTTEKMMSDVLNSIVKEEDRQRFIIQDLNALHQKNSIFVLREEILNEEDSGRENVPQVVHRTFCDIAVQVDEKDALGAINENITYSSFLSQQGTTFGEKEIDATNIPPAFTLVEKERSLLFTDGKNIPYKLRALMQYFPKIIRIPSLDWLHQIIMSIYVAKIISDDKRNSSGEIRHSLCEIVYFYFTDLFGLNTVADTQICSLLAACRYHCGKDARCKLFSIQIGLFCLDGDPTIDEKDTDFILEILRNLFERNQIAVESKTFFSSNKCNRANVNAVHRITNEQEINAEIHTKNLINLHKSDMSGKKKKSISDQVSKMNKIGIIDNHDVDKIKIKNKIGFDVGEDKNLDSLKSNININVNKNVKSYEDNVDIKSVKRKITIPDTRKSDDESATKNSISLSHDSHDTQNSRSTRSGNTVDEKHDVEWRTIRGSKFKSSVCRNVAICVTNKIFKKMHFDNELLNECLMKVKTLQCKNNTNNKDNDNNNYGMNGDCICVDDYLHVIFTYWNTIRKNWKKHTQYLFFEFCRNFKIIQEAQFANDNGTENKDSVLLEIEKAVSKNLPKRSQRNLCTLSNSKKRFMDVKSTDVNIAMNKVNSICSNNALKKVIQSSSDIITNISNNDIDVHDPMNDDDNDDEENNETELNGKMYEIGFVINNRKEDDLLYSVSNTEKPRKGSICQLMNRTGFQAVLGLLIPTLNKREVDKMFDSALAQNYGNTLKICKKMWRHVYTNQKPTSTRPTHHQVQEQVQLHSTPPLFSKYKTTECPTIMHINIVQRETQWTKPYSERTFCCQDITLEDFISVLLRYDLFAKSPMISLLYLAPEVLWSNIDIFGSQVDLSDVTGGSYCQGVSWVRSQNQNNKDNGNEREGDGVDVKHVGERNCTDEDREKNKNSDEGVASEEKNENGNENVNENVCVFPSYSLSHRKDFVSLAEQYGYGGLNKTVKRNETVRGNETVKINVPPSSEGCKVASSIPSKGN